MEVVMVFWLQLPVQVDHQSGVLFIYACMLYRLIIEYALCTKYMTAQQTVIVDLLG